MKIWLTLIILNTILTSYQDIDIDGVDDTIDICPNTSIEELADEYGCSISQNRIKRYGEITIRVGLDVATDNRYDNSSNLNLYLGYIYKNWDISISNSLTTQNRDNSSDRIYISIGKYIYFKENSIKISIGAEDNLKDKKYNKKKDGNQNRRDKTKVFISTDIIIPILNKSNILIYYMNPLNKIQKNSPKESPIISIGFDYIFIDDIYSSISYTKAGQIKNIDSSSSNIELFLNYRIKDNLFIYIGYAKALDKISYDMISSFGISITF